MAGPDPESFSRALTRFKATIDPSLQQEFSACTLRDVHRTIQDIQEKDAREGPLRAMSRLQAFVEAMEQLGSVIEVFLNASELVCFIWGPIKFLLTITRSFFNIFDKLLDAYSRIGDAIPGLLHYKNTFERHPPLAKVLEDYYSDVLNFHSQAIAVFRRPRWKTFFSVTWKTFETKFGPIIQSLARKREMLESEKGSATLHAIQNLREDIANVQREQNAQATMNDRENRRRRMREIQEKLQSPNYQLDQEMSAERRDGSASGLWIFDDSTFQAWLHGGPSSSKILYINGMPGAGKTVLMSTVIERLLHERVAPNGQSFVGYFYFKHRQNETHNAMLRAVLEQLLSQNPALSDHLFDKVSLLEGVNLRTTAQLERLVETAIESYTNLYLVLDGLDECVKEEINKTLNWSLSLIDEKLRNSGSDLRIILSGQRDGVLDTKLVRQLSISLETSAHNENIRRYCELRCKEIAATFFESSPNGEEAQSIKERIFTLVTNEAKGMFLYARVVLENLLGQTRLSGLKREIQADTFPRGIEKAYQRVFARVIDQAPKASREDAIKLLGLVIHARRILHWREIQAFFCIDPTSWNVDYDDRLLRTGKDICGALVDVHHCSRDSTGSEDLVRIVHESARMYLLEEHATLFFPEAVNVSTFCLQYLASDPFKIGIDSEDISSWAIKGYYALQDYSVQFWYDHSQMCLQAYDTLDPTQRDQVTASLAHFFESYSQLSEMGWHHGGNTVAKLMETFKNLPGHARDRNECFNIEYRTTMIRQQIEHLQQDSSSTEARESFDFLHGPLTTFKCSKPWCDWFKGGLENLKERQRHISRHELPFICNEDGCHTSGIGFDSQTALDIHRKRWHLNNSGSIQFPKKRQKSYRDICDAAKSGNVEAVTAFLNAGEPINVFRVGSLLCPMCRAARRGHVEVCKLLLDRGSNVNHVHPKQKEMTALHAAVGRSQLETTRLLLTHNDIQLDKTYNGKTAFDLACYQSDDRTCRLFLESGKFHDRLLNRSHTDVLRMACSKGDVSSVKYFLEHGFSKIADRSLIESMIHAQPPSSDANMARIIELLLATGNIELESRDILDSLEMGLVSVTRSMFCSSKLILTRIELEQCRQQATEKGYMDILPMIDSRLDSPFKPFDPAHDEFYPDDWSDTDSQSGVEITRNDWRLCQVKTRLFTSSTAVTQYWIWLPENGCFQHQVMKNVDPVSWSSLEDHIDFHVYLDEIEELLWNIEWHRIHIIMSKVSDTMDELDGAPRGDVMASFKRDRTMRRFLFFCRERGVKMQQQPIEEINRRWQKIEGELLLPAQMSQ
ncbi:NACHT domain-containing protein [Fusarium sp. LHS14.1]|nr:NACHT domain-containing protein [Fusarium sp. LHS14.1]